jgi:glycosyltransferase involved in cell wall biosynthesis
MPLVSVIIPVHNRAHEMSPALDGLLAQTLTDFEVLIIDDHSTDHARDLARQYASRDERFVPLDLPDPSRGAPAARNVGVARSRGEFVIFLDSDDALSPHALEARTRFLQSRPDLDFCVSRTQLFRENVGDIPQLWNADTGDDDLLRLLRGDVPWQTTGPTWRRASLDRIIRPIDSTHQLWDESAQSGQDWEFHIRALLSHLKYERLDIIDSHWRTHSKGRSAIGISSHQVDHARARPLLLQKIIRTLDTHAPNRKSEWAPPMVACVWEAAEHLSRQATAHDAQSAWQLTSTFSLAPAHVHRAGHVYWSNPKSRRASKRLKLIESNWPHPLMPQRGRFYNRAPISTDHVPELAIVMSAYNVAPYIEQAVRSILQQGFRDFEFIIIDDGSTDETGAILERLAAADCRIRLVRRANKGLTVSLNEAIAMTRSPFIGRMDGDDIARPGRLMQQMKYLRENPDCVLLGTRVMNIDPLGVPLYESKLLESHEAIDRELLMGRGGSVVHPTVIMRHDALKRVGFYREEFNNSEDLDLFLRLAEIGRVHNLPDILLDYRRHLSSVNYTRFENQKRIKHDIIAQAFARRGTTMPADWKTSEWKPTTGAAQLREWAWNALKQNRPRIARTHALAALRLEPFKRSNYTLLLRAIRACRRGAP